MKYFLLFFILAGCSGAEVRATLTAVELARKVGCATICHDTCEAPSD